MHPLDALAGWPAGQDALLRDLDGLYDRGHEHLYLDVVEKGGKERRIEVPLRLIATTLKFYVWKHRAGRIRSIRSIHRTWQPPDRLWLSETRHAAICKGTISNRLQRAFKLAVNDGGPSLSGHRLRAFYASSLIERLYLNARADQGRFVDLGAILDVACELMGLSQRETLKHYLHQLHTGGLSRPGQALYVADRHDAELLRGLAAAMAQGTGELRKVLHDVAAAFEVPPLSEPGGLGDQDSAMLASQTTRARD